MAVWVNLKNIVMKKPRHKSASISMKSCNSTKHQVTLAQDCGRWGWLQRGIMEHSKVIEAFVA